MQQETTKNKIRDGILNILTTIITILIVFIVIVQVSIFLNPNIFFNPLPPYQLPEKLVIEKPTVTAIVVDDQPTSTIPAIMTATEVVVPTATEIGIFSDGTPVVETTPIPPTQTPFSGYYAFVLQNDINAIDSTLFKPNYGCNWIGVAGQVFDLQGRPVMGVRVWLRGMYNGKRIDLLSLTLESSPYGPSGFEFTLGEELVNSKGQLFIQLLDQANIPISDRIYFDTYEDCNKNLILINFKQIR